MEYKELVEQESQLKKSQVLYIKEVLAQNNGRVEMKYKPQEEFEAVPGRHGTFNLHVTAVYEDHNGSLRCEGINDNTDSLEKKIYFCDESYSSIAYFLHQITNK